MWIPSSDEAMNTFRLGEQYIGVKCVGPQQSSQFLDPTPLVSKGTNTNGNPKGTRHNGATLRVFRA